MEDVILVCFMPFGHKEMHLGAYSDILVLRTLFRCSYILFGFGLFNMEHLRAHFYT